jgi:predicted NAD/FAD-binding protein
VFTCPAKELGKFPADIVLSALAKIAGDASGSKSLAPLLRTTHGTFDVAERLLANVADVKLSTSVKQVFQRDPDRVFVRTDQGDLSFDHVVIATQANHVRKLYDHTAETDVLDRFDYVDVPVLVHTDDSVMPLSPKDWSTFNFRNSSFAQSRQTKKCQESQESTCTVWMNRFHSNWPKAENLFQSIFPSEGIANSKIVASANLQRPVVNKDSEALYSQLDRMHAEPDRRIWFAGSYAARGVPLLESAVVSSKNVTRRIEERMARSRERAL